MYVAMRSGNSLFRSVGIVAISTILSRVIGYLRDMLMALFFGATRWTDVFYVAFLIPNLLRRLVAEGAMSMSFIPVYTEYLVRKGEGEALILGQKTLTVQTAFTLLCVLAGVLYSPEIMEIFYRDPGTIRIAADMNRIMFPYLACVGFVAFSMGVLNSHGYFFSPSFSPVLLNVGIILGIIVFSRYFSMPLYGVALGVIVGGILQILLQIPFLLQAGFRFRVSFDLNHPGIRRIFSLLVPAVFGIAVYQFNILIASFYATMLASGSVTYIYYTNRFTELVLGIFVVAIGNVMLPAMSKSTAARDYQELRRLFMSSLSASLFLAVPAAVALACIGYPILSVMIMHGEFSPRDAEMTAMSIRCASMSIPSLAVIRIATPAFYSLKDTRTPVLCAAVNLVIFILLGFVLMRTPLMHAGLMLANSISVTAQMALLLFFLRRRIGGIGGAFLFRKFLLLSASSGVMALSVFLIAGTIDWNRDDIATRALALAAAVAVGMLVYFTVSYIAGIDEAGFLVQRARKMLAGRQSSTREQR